MADEVYALEAVLSADADVSGIAEFSAALDALEAQLSGFSGETIDVRFNVVGEEEIASFRAQLESLTDEEIMLRLNTDGFLSEAAAARASLAAIPDETVELELRTDQAGLVISSLSRSLREFGDTVSNEIPARFSVLASAGLAAGRAIQGGFEAASDAIERLADGVAAVVQRGLGRSLIDALNGIRQAVVSLGDLVGDTLASQFRALGASAVAAAQAIQGGFGAAGAAVIRFADSVEAAGTAAFERLTARARAMGDAVRSSMSDALGAVREFGAAVVNGVEHPILTAQRAAESFGSGARSAFRSAADGVDQLGEGVRRGQALFRALFDSISSGVRAAISGLSSLAQGVASVAQGFFSVASAVVKAIAPLAAVAGAVLLISSAVSGLVGILGSVTTILFGLVSLGGLFAGALVIGFGLVAAAGLRMSQALKENETNLLGLRQAASDFSAAYKSAFNDAAVSLADLSQKALEFGTSVMPTLGQAADTAVQGIARGFENLTNNVFPQVSDAAKRIFEGLGPVLENVTTAVGTFGAALLEVISAAMPQIEALSKDIADLATKFLEWANSVQGQTAIKQFFEDLRAAMPGIKEGITAIVDALRNMADVDIAKFGQQFADFGESVGKVIDFVEQLANAWTRLNGIMPEGTAQVNNATSAFGNWMANTGPLSPLLRAVGLSATEAGKGAEEAGQSARTFGQGFKTGADEAGQATSQLKIKVTQDLVAATSAVRTESAKAPEAVRAGYGRTADAAQAGLTGLTPAVRTAFHNANAQVANSTAEMARIVTRNMEVLRNNVQVGMEGARTAFETGFEGMGSTAESSMENIVSAVESGMDSAVSAVTSGSEEMASAAESGMQSMVSAAESGMSSFTASIDSGMASASASAQAGAAAIVAAMQGLPGELSAVGAAAMAGLVAGLESGRAAAVGTAASIASDITAAFKANLQIASPSRVFRFLGQMVMRGLGLGLKENGGLAITSVQRTADDIRGVMFGLTDDLSAMSLDGMLSGLSDTQRIALARTGELSAAPAISRPVAEGAGGTARLERKLDQLTDRNDANTEHLIEQNQRIGRDQMESFVRGVVAANRAFAGSPGFKNVVDDSLLEMVGRVLRENPG